MDINASTLKDIAFGDVERELAVTRTVLERLPVEHYPWKPHAKSMSMGQLAVHVTGLVDWMRVSIAFNELDASKAPSFPGELTNRAALLERFDQNAAALRQAIARFDVTALDGEWTMRKGGEVLVARPRTLVYRVWSLNHLIHHRAQLCVYLRLLDIPVPTVYFKSADDPTWVFA